MDDALRERLKALGGVPIPEGATVRGTGIVSQCAGCRGWFSVLTLFRGVGLLCVECAEGFRSILGRCRF